MENKKTGSNQLVMQGSILAIASLIVRLIGLGYRIPLVNILTDVGSGYYGAAYDVYAFLLIISSYGFPAAVSKVVANRLAHNKYKEAHIIFKSSLVLSVVIGAVFSLALFFGAEAIANFIKMEKAVYALQGLAPALFIFSAMSVIRGYFQGMNTMVPTAISQIIEQIFNAIFSLVFGFLLLKQGVEFGAAGSSLGTAIGALAGLVFLVFIYAVMRPLIHKRCEKDLHNIDEGNILYYWKMLLMISVPMLLGTTAFQIAGVIDMAMFTRALDYYGYNEVQIPLMNGILSGKYKILITLPISLATAMGTATIPSLTASLVRKDKKVILKKVDMTLRSVLLISIPSAVGLMVLARPIVELLFTKLDYINITVALIQLGSISVIFFSVASITTAILQGLDMVHIPVRNAVIALIVKVLFNVLLLYVINMNLYGAVLTNIIFALTSMVLNILALRKRIHLSVNIYKTILAPLLASVLMAGVVTIIYFASNLLFSGDFAALVALAFGVVSYGITVFKLGAFDENEISSLPFGKHLKRLL